MRRQCRELSNYLSANDGRGHAHDHVHAQGAHECEQEDCCVFHQHDCARRARNGRVGRRVSSARVLSSAWVREAGMVACLQNKKVDGQGICMQTMLPKTVFAGLPDLWDTTAVLIFKR